ncbi:MAG TPA: SIR2 family protein [Chloroflexia bacterium]
MDTGVQNKLEAFVEEIAEQIKEHPLIPVIGAGVSIATTQGTLQFPGWSDLLNNGIEFAQKEGVGPAKLQTVRELLSGGNHVGAARELARLLGAPGGPFLRWLRHVFKAEWDDIRAFPPERRQLIETIFDLPSKLIATTNYDKLLSMMHPRRWDTVTWDEDDALADALRTGQKILHLHGIYDKPDTVIFGQDDYNVIGKRQSYRDVLQAMWLVKTLLFVGCSIDGLEDPDFMRLLTWAYETFGKAEVVHYALVSARKLTPEKKEEFLNTWRIKLIGYSSPEELIWCLSKLAERFPRGGEFTMRNMPTSLAGFVGRDEEKAALINLLRKPGVRLVSLCGPSGVGKSHLAVEVVRALEKNFLDRAVGVSLAGLTNHEFVFNEIANELGVQASGGQSVKQAIASNLQKKDMLLVLDNFERVLGAAQDLQSILDQAPGVKCLVTSTISLEIQGEHKFELEPLKKPGGIDPTALELVKQNEAIRLFTALVREEDPHFELTIEEAPVIIDICNRLEGFPLALILVAKRINDQKLPEIQAGLTHSLALEEENETQPSSDPDQRHKSLRAAVGWTYALLTAEEQLLFLRLGVFRGGRTVQAITQVCNVEGDLGDEQRVQRLLAALNRKSMLSVESYEGRRKLSTTRYIMNEILHDFASKGLQETSEAEVILEKHAHYFLELARRAEEQAPTDYVNQLHEVELERDNLRAAFRWAVGRRPDIALQLCSALTWSWYARGLVREGREWSDQALNRAGSPSVLVDDNVRAKALETAGYLALLEGNHRDAEPYLRESLTLFERLNSDLDVAIVKRHLAGVEISQSEYDLADELLQESVRLCETLGQKRELATALMRQAYIALQVGNYKRAKSLHERILRLYTELKDRWGIAAVNSERAVVALQGEEVKKARDLLNEALQVSEEFEDKYGKALALLRLGELERGEKRYREAHEFYEQARVLFEELGNRRNLGYTLCNLGYADLNRGEYVQAAGNLKKALELFANLDHKHGVGICLGGWAALAGRQDNMERATLLLAAASKHLIDRKAKLERVDAAEFARWQAECRSQLSERIYKSLWLLGSKLTTDEAISYALKR